MSEIFDESCDPLPIEEEKKLSHLAFADDLAMSYYQRLVYNNV